MLRTAITSTNIREAAWDDNALYLLFNNGRTYKYDAVPESVYQKLISAESAGKFFHAEIKPRFTATEAGSEFFAGV